MQLDPFVMTVQDVCAALGVSAGRVRQLDQLLQPVRRIGSRHRRYNPQIVAQVAADRAARVK